jgi:bacillolysin
MRKRIKNILALVLVLSCMMMVAIPAAAFYSARIDYAAFGDSVAAGVRAVPGETPGWELSSDYGYTDNIAKLIGYNLGSFNEDFCTSGQTAAGLVTQINNDKGYFNSLVKNAEIVTIDIGANDLLAPLYAYFASLPEGTDLSSPAVIAGGQAVLNGMISNLSTTGRSVQMNLEKILQSMLTANKKVKIYVMGYYNPLPALKAYGMDLTVPVAYFNTFIIRAIANVAYRNWGASITYVPTMVPMAMSDPLDPNLIFPDIHPTERGYEVIATQFWTYMKYAVR